MRYSVTALLGEEPVTAKEVRERLHLLPGNSDEETYTILPLITAAREYCESRAGYAFIPQRITAWPSAEELAAGEFYLPRPPVTEIEGVVACGASGGQAALSGWQLIADDGPLVLDVSGLSGARAVDPVAVTYKAGAESCPEMAKQAMLLLIGHWYMHREAVVTGSAPAEVALTVDALLRQYRRWW